MRDPLAGERAAVIKALVEPHRQAGFVAAIRAATLAGQSELAETILARAVLAVAVSDRWLDLATYLITSRDEFQVSLGQTIAELHEAALEGP